MPKTPAICLRRFVSALATHWVLLGLVSCGNGEACPLDKSQSNSAEEVNCAAAAEADWLVSAETALPVHTVAEAPYSNAACPNRFVAEIDLQNRVLPNLYYVRTWPDGFFRNKKACESATYSVSVYRKIADAAGGEEWERTPFDEYRLGGVWKEPACNAKNTDGGLIGPGRINDAVGDPLGWVDISEQPTGRVRAVRLILSGTSECEQTPFGIQFRSSF